MGGAIWDRMSGVGAADVPRTCEPGLGSEVPGSRHGNLIAEGSTTCMQHLQETQSQIVRRAAVGFGHRQPTQLCRTEKRDQQLACRGYTSGADGCV